MHLIVDAHEDLAWNMLTFGRDYTRSAAETRQAEAGGPIPAWNEDTLLGWADYCRGGVAVVFATLFAAPARRRQGEWETQVYRTFDEAHRLYRDQLQAYHALADRHPDCFRLIGTQADLQAVLDAWTDSGGHPVGLVPLMEGGEGVRDPRELEEWWEMGLRLLGPAWAGTRFCGGTREPGPLTDEGRALLHAMADLNLPLDISHMDERAALQALEEYPGPILASHSNQAALLPGARTNRHMSARVLRGLIERDGVVGAVPFNRFLDAGWQKGDPRDGLTLERVADQIDLVCQTAGNARHAGLGSDFDGGFGLQSAPADVETIADLQKLAPLLTARGYADDDVAAILGGNWLRLLKESLPT